MRVIAENKVVDITASSSDTSYPASNMLTKHPKKPWKSDGDHSATLLFDLQSGTSGLALFSTNALTVEASIYDPTDFSLGTGWSLESSWTIADAAFSEINVEAELDGENGSAWISWDKIDSPTFVQLTLQSEFGTTLNVGEAVGGEEFRFANPNFGLTESEEDFSIVIELSNGSIATIDRDVVRLFSGEIYVNRDVNFYNFMNNVSKIIKSNPTAWWLIDNDNDYRWVVYARMPQRPSGKHDHPKCTVLDISWKEVL